MKTLQGVWEVIVSIFTNSGYAYFFTADGGYKNAIMLLVAFVFLYLGIKKGFEPLLMVPIAFGMLLANIPEANLAYSIMILTASEICLQAEANLSVAHPVLWTSFISVLKPVFIHRLFSLV